MAVRAVVAKAMEAEEVVGATVMEVVVAVEASWEGPTEVARAVARAKQAETEETEVATEAEGLAMEAVAEMVLRLPIGAGRALLLPEARE